MNSSLIALVIIVLLTVITTFADILIKNASIQNAFSGWPMLLIGSLIYGLTGIGWFFAMRKLKLSSLGAIFSISTILLLSLVSIFYFKEKISGIEIVGILMAIVSIGILYRFAS